jgi:hypothetical protein
MTQIKTNTARILFELKEGRQVWQLERSCGDLIGNLMGVVITVSLLSFIREFERGKGVALEIIADTNVDVKEFERIVKSIAKPLKDVYAKGNQIIIFNEGRIA